MQKSIITFIISIALAGSCIDNDPTPNCEQEIGAAIQEVEQIAAKYNYCTIDSDCVKQDGVSCDSACQEYYINLNETNNFRTEAAAVDEKHCTAEVVRYCSFEDTCVQSTGVCVSGVCGKIK